MWNEQRTAFFPIEFRNEISEDRLLITNVYTYNKPSFNRHIKLLVNCPPYVILVAAVR